ncbi:uncharacterized protein LOC110614472 [Manihot esculenta]|uniref:uncharacterized protein LOC110614472 n=1 Tax=Manihot esculenta TaxID=3983 RepID=UPI000B5D43F0|nr:uncharacterized protein LOC110614472 [Manihot esculenta]
MEEDGLVHRSTRKRRKKLDGEPELEDTEEDMEDSSKGRTNGAPSFRDMVVNGGGDTRVSESIGIPNTDNATDVLLDKENDEEKDELCPEIRLSREEKERLYKLWSRSLLIKLMGKTISYTYLLWRIKEPCKPTSPIDIISIENVFYLVKFNSADDYEHALLEGPWVIADHYLTICRWCPEFDPFQATFEKLTVWIQFPCLPIEYYDENFLMRVGAKVGKPIRVDTRTSLVSRGRFARMCVEVDLSKPLLSKFKLQKRIRKIEYGVCI